MKMRVGLWLALLGLIALLSAAPPGIAIADTGAAGPSSSASAAGSAPADSAPDDDIRDIRGPKYIFPLWQAAAWAAGVALLAAAGYAWWRRMQRRTARKLELFEIALQRLDAARALMHPSSVEQYSVAISDIVRQYIEAAMHITATHRTTEEFLRDLLASSNASLAAHRDLLADFLSQCDMAKFAGVGLSMQIMESLHRSARSFVIETAKPIPAAQPVAA